MLLSPAALKHQAGGTSSRGFGLELFQAVTTQCSGIPACSSGKSTGFKSQFWLPIPALHLPDDGCLWTSNLTGLSLSFLICKIRGSHPFLAGLL